MTSTDGGVVRVRAGGGAADYDVIVGEGLLEELPGLVRERAPAHRYAVIADDTVAPLHGKGVAAALGADLLTFPAGERHKTRRTWAELTDRLLAAGHGRDSAVVAVGGGVTGDMAGFVAATFMRGVPVVQVPTSLVAMVDASVGGKTGVDVPTGKNLVGAFHPPRLVAADPSTIGTLPRPERAQGLAEAVKHGAILDRSYLERLDQDAERLLAGEPEAVARAVRRSVELKADVVSRDEREGGLREILNFGHTLGHALEAASGFALPHGSAVALGMVLEARLGERIGVTRPGTEEILARTLRRVGLPVRSDEAPGAVVDPGALLVYVRIDKKGRGGRPRCVLLEEPGAVHATPEGRWSVDVEEGPIRELLEEVGSGA